MPTFIKNIAIWYSSLECMGGIESVVVEQCRIFSDAGYQVRLITDIPICLLKSRISCSCRVISNYSNQERAKDWRNLCREDRPDLVIFHRAGMPYVMHDVQLLHKLGVKTALNIHFSFNTPILIDGDGALYQENLRVALECDAVATVSEADCIWWHALGARAFHVQNPIARSIFKSTQDIREPHTLIWLGRIEEPKLPEEALKIFRLVLDAVPDARLLMLGGQSRALNKLIHQMGLQDHVDVIPATPDVDAYYSRASLHLLTSITESFCLVLAEAKLRGIPTAMYNIPFLELVQGGKGLVTSEIYDAAALSSQIIRVLTDEKLRHTLSQEAVESLYAFNDEHVLTSWESIFQSLKSESTKTRSLTMDQQVFQEIYKAWNYHYKKNYWKIQFFNDMEKMFGRFPQMIAHVMQNFMEWIKRMKRLIIK